MTPTTSYRAALALAAGTALFLLMAMGALGIIGAAGDRADLMYLGVLAVAVAGSLVARFRAGPMAIAMTVTAGAVAVVGVIALAAGLGPMNPRIEIVGLTGMFMSLFLVAAWLFHRASEGQAPAGEPRRT